MKIETKRKSLTKHLHLPYYKLPKFLYHVSPYSELPPAAKDLYAILLDRNNLSIINNWVDNKGEIFQYFSVEELAKLLKKSTKAIINYKKQLAKLGLIEEVRQGFNMPNRIYILDITNEKQLEEYVYQIEKKIQTEFSGKYEIPAEKTAEKTEKSEKTAEKTAEKSEKTPPALEPQGSVKSTLLEVTFLHTNKIESIKNKIKNNNNISIYVVVNEIFNSLVGENEFLLQFDLKDRSRIFNRIIKNFDIEQNEAALKGYILRSFLKEQNKKETKLLKPLEEVITLEQINETIKEIQNKVENMLEKQIPANVIKNTVKAITKLSSNQSINNLAAVTEKILMKKVKDHNLYVLRLNRGSSQQPRDLKINNRVIPFYNWLEDSDEEISS